MPYWSEKEARTFYERWKLPAFTFCRLFLGDQRRAEDVALEGLLAYFREGHPLELTRLPDSLLRCVLEAARNQCATARLPEANRSPLESALLSLPCEQRAVFVLRSVLAVPIESVAVATGFPPERVKELWIEGLLRLRSLLPDNFFKEYRQ
ncbi:MAG: RNA polymerase sigma factor [Acidobacteriota bacterium]